MIAALGLTACGGASSARSGSHPQTSATPPAWALDAVFTSPTGLYTIRSNRTWSHQQVISAAGPVDSFKLPNATFAVTMDRVQPGTQLETYVRAEIDAYHSVNMQGVQRDGPISVAGGHAELLQAVTYVDALGQTVAQQSGPDARAYKLYQAFYLAGEQSFTFSIAWPQDDPSDYLSLFRSLLQTFTLTATS